ncbi:MAG: hypothetical protein HY088_00985 [Ignavibacteriales bacterium]|nr:hypothetical protein [Ignavibacteriales bacterium]
MTANRRVLYTLALLLCGASVSFSQYFGERVLEKSFEHTDFFFKPHYIVPFGIGSFKSSTAGLIDDPLLNLSVNPANLYSDSTRMYYFYADFRSAREIRNEGNYISPLDSRAAYDMMSFAPYPRYYVNTRTELEPVFSGAFLTRPLGSLLPQLFVGISFQAIAQDEKYYAIPQDIYRSAVNRDYAGKAMTDNATMPIIDRYSGTDYMRQTGSFVSLFSGYEFSNDLQVGLKIGRGAFNRDGSFGSNNLWGYAQQSSYTSFWSSFESRNQEYSHWDLAAGINYKLHEKIRAGITLGYLWGDVTQGLARSDSSFWGNGQLNIGTNWNYYMRSGVTSQSWDRQNKTSYGGVNLTSQLSNAQSLSLYYSFLKQNTDIALGSDIRDTSYSNSRNEGNNYFYRSQSDYNLSDVRTGSGTSIMNLHHFLMAFHWQVEPKIRLNIGFQVDVQDTKTDTKEFVLADRRSGGEYVSRSNNYNYENKYFNATKEEKNLLWNFRASITTYQIPVFFTIRSSEYVELLLGINRKLSSWKIEETTLALFRFREEATQDGTTRKDNFGERYTMPKETVTDVRTTVLAGITVFPSKLFNIRLLVVPNFVDTYEGSKFQDLQWWIGINLFP